MASRVPVIALLAVFACDAEQKMAQPKYAEGNQLVRPEGYREWIFMGSNLGMGYREGQPTKSPNFHNLYIQPEAYREFVATGKFPDKTILIMEQVSVGTNASINKQGQFEDRFIGIEAAVKDEKRFSDKWAYFDFIGSGGSRLSQAKPFAKQACWNCHNEHGAVDNVFVQFYPVLKEARAGR